MGLLLPQDLPTHTDDVTFRLDVLRADPVVVGESPDGDEIGSCFDIPDNNSWFLHGESIPYLGASCQWFAWVGSYSMWI